MNLPPRRKRIRPRTSHLGQVCACFLWWRDLNSGANILGRAIISHHVLLTGMCWNFFRGPPIMRNLSPRPTQKTGLSRGMAQSGQLGKHTRSWREASVIGDDWNSNSDGLRKHRSCGRRCQNDGRGKSFYLVIDILHLSGPIAHLRRSCSNQTGIRSPVFPSRQNATSRFSEWRFGTRGRNAQLGKKAE